MTLPFAVPDRTCPLVPSSCPWLAHTPYWERLNEPERLRANQLMGLLINELSLFIEDAVLRIGLARARQACQRIALHQRLDRLLADEERHSSWFRAYNHAFAPELYGADGYCFIRPARPWRWLGRMASACPGSWPVAAWLALASEEWSTVLATQLAESNEALDPAFRDLHLTHMREELPHVRFDLDVLQAARSNMPTVICRLHATVAYRLLCSVLRPRRGAQAMLRQFVTEYPRWQLELPGLIAAVRRVGASAAYWRERGDLPLTTAEARAWGVAWQGVAHA